MDDLVALVDTIFLEMVLRGLLCIIFSLIKFDKVIPKQALKKERIYLSYLQITNDRGLRWGGRQNLYMRTTVR